MCLMLFLLNSDSSSIKFFTCDGFFFGGGFDFFNTCVFLYTMHDFEVGAIFENFSIFSQVQIFYFFRLRPLISFFASSRSFLNLIISSITSIINTAFFSCSAHTIALICVIIYRSLILCKTFLLHGWNWHDRYHTFLPLSYICLSALLSLHICLRGPRQIRYPIQQCQSTALV